MLMASIIANAPKSDLDFSPFRTEGVLKVETVKRSLTLDDDATRVTAFLDNLTRHPDIKNVCFETMTTENRRPHTVIVAKYKSGRVVVYKVAEECKLCNLIAGEYE